MKILLWNCNNGISKQTQIDYFKSFDSDIAVIPELKKHNIEKLNPSSSIWITNNFENKTPKGLGILGFDNVQLELLPRDEDMEIYIPIKVSTSKLNFTLLAVWNFYWACKQGRFKDLKGDNCLEWAALEHYKPILKDPSLIAGDWNFGPTFSQEAFVKLNNILNKQGIKSLYHDFENIPVTDTKNYTYKSPMKTFHHLDHMFGSSYFLNKMKNFKVSSLDEAILSDHASLLLELND